MFSATEQGQTNQREHRGLALCSEQTSEWQWNARMYGPHFAAQIVRLNPRLFFSCRMGLFKSVGFCCCNSNATQLPPHSCMPHAGPDTGGNCLPAQLAYKTRAPMVKRLLADLSAVCMAATALCTKIHCGSITVVSVEHTLDTLTALAGW